MALQDKNIMSPPWLAHPEIERYSIGWRMGYGEDYIDRFYNWLDTLSPEEQTEYYVLFPEPVTWKGYWNDEDTCEVLNTVIFAYMLGNRMVSLSTPNSGSSRSLPLGGNGNCACSGDTSLLRTAAPPKAASVSGGWRTFTLSTTPISVWSNT